MNEWKEKLLKHIAGVFILTTEKDCVLEGESESNMN
jgi:hypothetical protein